MKQTIKYLLLGALAAFATGFTACDTDIEPIGQRILGPEEQNPQQYAAYLQALNAYKTSEHYLVYASMDNAPDVPGSEKDFLRSMPDSLDIVTLANGDGISQYDIEDIPTVQAKGTRVLYGVNYNDLHETMDAAAFGSYLEGVKQKVAQYGLDGVAVRYDGPMDAAATEAAAKVVEKLASLTGKTIVSEGTPIFVPRESQDLFAYFVLNNTDAINTFNLRSQLSYATGFAGIDPSKVLLSAEPAGKLTDETLTQQPAIAETAKRVVTLGPLAGLGIYRVGEDYFDAYTNYKQTKQAIHLLNPASSK